MKNNIIAFLAVITMIAFISCGGSEETTDENAEAPKSMISDDDSGDDMSNKGIGPVSSLELAAVDNAMADEGAKVFEEKCTACHKMGKKHIGPDLTGVTTRRSPEWVMNMILNPEEMVKDDPIAKALLVEYNMSPMANQSLTEEEARSILEYFRVNE